MVIVDEISRSAEVKAAGSSKTRGVRLIASAHGNSLNDLMANGELSGLLGSRQGTIAQGGVSITNVTSDPIFEIVVMLTSLNEWLVCFDVRKAHQVMCTGKDTYSLQRRIRNKDTGTVTVDTFSKGPGKGDA